MGPQVLFSQSVIEPQKDSVVETIAFGKHKRMECMYSTAKPMYTNSCMVGENDNEDDCICEAKFYLIVTL